MGFQRSTWGNRGLGGADRTSSGLAQLLGTVGKGARRVVAAVDRGIIRPKVQASYEFNMQHDPDPTIKGDLRAATRGTAAMLIKDQAQMRRKELLQATMNPLDAQIMGVKGRAHILREVVKGADIDAEKVIPDGLDLELVAANMPQPAELLGKIGPNSPAAPGLGGSGGTPAAEPNMDDAGMPVNGTRQREASLGYAEGGIVSRRRRFRIERDDDGSVYAEEFDDQ